MRQQEIDSQIVENITNCEVHEITTCQQQKNETWIQKIRKIFRIAEKNAEQN